MQLARDERHVLEAGDEERESALRLPEQAQETSLGRPSLEEQGERLPLPEHPRIEIAPAEQRVDLVAALATDPADDENALHVPSLRRRSRGRLSNFASP